VTAPREEILIVSDLHLDASVRDRGTALASFVRASAGAGPQRLVLLGDSLDLPTHVSRSRADAADRWSTAAADAVDRIADAQPEAFDALTTFVNRGGRLELLPGNHDVSLQVPVVRKALLDRLGDAGGAVGWHPWILHIPGLLWAEHGGQHHDLHAVPEWLSPGPTRSTWGLPPGRAIEALSRAARDRRPSRELVRAAAAVAADAIASAVARPALARSRRTYRARDVPACAAALELPVPLIVAIDRLSETDAWSIAARLIRRRLARGEESPASFLGPAARLIHAILAADGRDVPIYAFGHTHTPAVLPLGPSAPGAWFANAGSWAGLRPAALDRRIGPGRYPFLRISAGEDRDPTIELNLWNAVQEQVEPLPGRSGRVAAVD
jgi:predicted phosphodiesterase